MRKALLGVGVLGIVLATGCGSTTTTTTTATVTAAAQVQTVTTTVTKTAVRRIRITATKTTQSAHPGGGTSGGQPGAGSQTVRDANGNSLLVGRPEVFDPAQGADQLSQPDSGKRFVAIDFSLRNTSGSTITDDINNDVTLIGTDSQSYTPDFDGVSECTNFNEGEYTLTPGNAESGCVVYQVPNGIDIKLIQFTLNSFSGDVAQWTGPA